MDNAIVDRAVKRMGWGDFVGAAEDYERLLTDVSAKELRTQPFTAILSNLAYCHQQTQDHARAAQCFELAIAADATLHRLRAVCFSYGELKRWVDMRRAAEHALRLSPEDDYALQQLALAADEMGDWKAAASANEKGLAINPNNAYAAFNLANIRFKNELGDHLPLYERALRLAPELHESFDPSGEDAGLFDVPELVAWVEKAKRRTVSKKKFRKGADIAANEALGEWVVDACLANDVDSARRAIASGASLEYRTKRIGRTVLAAAVMAGCVEIVRECIKRHVDVNARDHEGNTALILLVQEEPEIELAKYLLDHGANVDCTNEDGWSALHFASSWDERWDSVVSCLLAHGADPNVSSKDGWTPLLLSIPQRPSLAILTKSKKVDVDARGAHYGWTALIFAARAGSERIVSELLGLGANPNLQMKVGKGKPHRPKETLARNVAADIRVPPKFDGYTALMWACSKGRTKVVQRLLAAGANPKLRASDGSTAASLAKTKAVKALLS